MRALRAAQPPIDTWSSVAALVDRESTEDGWHRALFSDTGGTAALVNVELKMVGQYVYFTIFMILLKRLC